MWLTLSPAFLAIPGGKEFIHWKVDGRKLETQEKQSLCSIILPDVVRISPCCWSSMCLFGFWVDYDGEVEGLGGNHVEGTESILLFIGMFERSQEVQVKKRGLMIGTILR